MKITDLLTEGAFVVKSTDGVEKRFKSADSAEAKAWKSSTQKKSKAEKFTQAWWDDKDSASQDDDEVFPHSKIGQYELDQTKLSAAFKQGGWAARNIDDWTVGKKGVKTVQGVQCATAAIRVSFVYTKDDDIGVDEPTSDSQTIYVARDPKNPKKFIFAGYAH